VSPTVLCLSGVVDTLIADEKRDNHLQKTLQGKWFEHSCETTIGDSYAQWKKFSAYSFQFCL